MRPRRGRACRKHAIALLCAVFAACDVGIEPEPGPTLVRFVNVAPDAVGPLEFVLSGGPSAVVERGGQSEYVTVEPRSYAVVIEDDVASWHVDGNVRIVQGLVQTMYAFGDASSETAVLVGDEPQPPAQGRSLLRFLHLASALQGTVDLHVLEVGEAVDPLSPVAGGRAFATQQEYFFLTSGSRRIVLATTGTADIVIDSGPLEFTSGAWYTSVLLNDDVGVPELIRLRDGS